MSDSSVRSAGNRSTQSVGNQSTLKHGQRLWTEDVLGVESSRACRLYPGRPAAAATAVVATLVLPPLTIPVTSGATGNGVRPACGNSDSSPATTRIACGDAHGTVQILVGTPCGSSEDGSPAYLFRDGVEVRLQTPTADDTSERAPGVQCGSVVQLAMAGGWLYAATEDGAVVAWKL